MDWLFKRLKSPFTYAVVVLNFFSQFSNSIAWCCLFLIPHHPYERRIDLLAGVIAPKKYLNTTKLDHQRHCFDQPQTQLPVTLATGSERLLWN